MIMRKKPEELRSHRWYGVDTLRAFGHRSRSAQMGYARADYLGKPVIALDCSGGASPLKYVNHSCKPNAFMRIAHGRVEFYARRAIAAGEELTAHYGETHHGGTLACRCGALGCQLFI